MGVSENVVYPIVPNGFADHYPVFKWLAIIGNINPTFSGPNPDVPLPCLKVNPTIARSQWSTKKMDGISD